MCILPRNFILGCSVQRIKTNCKQVIKNCVNTACTNICVFCLKKYEGNKFGYLKFTDDVCFSFMESTNEVLNVAANISFIWGKLIC